MPRYFTSTGKRVNSPNEIEKKLLRYKKVETSLRTILNDVDYTVGNCRVNEMVGAVLPKELIALARKHLAELDKDGA